MDSFKIITKKMVDVGHVFFTQIRFVISRFI
jgi:hypothetical protein